jgi:hypothetical protein
MLRTLLLALAGILTLGTASAQTSLWMKAEIPFSFYVGDQMLPSGSYEVLRIADLPAVLRMRKAQDGNHGVFFLFAQADLRTAQATTSQLEFVKYDNDHVFLKKMVRGDGLGYQLGMSRTEREYVTSNLITSSKPPTVVLIAQAR